MSKWGSPRVVPGNGWSQDPVSGPKRYPLLVVAHGKTPASFEQFVGGLSDSFDARRPVSVNRMIQDFNQLDRTMQGVMLLRVSEVSLGEDTPERSLEEQALTLATTANFAIVLLVEAGEDLARIDYLRRSEPRRKAIRMIAVRQHAAEQIRALEPPLHEQFPNVRGNFLSAFDLERQHNFIVAQMQRAALDTRAA